MTTSDSQTALETPVLFLVFNRPDTTRQVFEAIRQARPTRLYVAADGPRAGRPGEADRCAEVCKIATAVDWPCEVKTLFRELNLGCGRAVSEAITWFFEHEEEGIILEDDCLPHPDFFLFCQTLLERYRHNERVWVITGNNFQRGQWRGEGSYYFSRFNHCWGWASWRRAWKHADMSLGFWPKWKDSDEWRAFWPNGAARRYWTQVFDRMYRREIDTWDYPWTACVWYHGGLTATPNVNLVSNIGFGGDATHTKGENDPNANLPVRSLGLIYHPTEIRVDEVADRFTFDYHFGGRYFRFPWELVRLPLRFFRRLWRVVVINKRGGCN